MSKKERPPYLTYKRRSRLGESFWYLQFGHFFNRRGLFLQPRWRREITITADSAIDYTAGIEGVVAIPAALRFPPTVALVRNNLSRMHIQSGSCRGAADHDRCIRSER